MSQETGPCSDCSRCRCVRHWAPWATKCGNTHFHCNALMAPSWQLTRPTGQHGHFTRCAIRCRAKSQVAQALHTCQQAAPWGPPKTMGNHAFPARPRKGRKLCLSSKSYAYRRTLIKTSQNEGFRMVAGGPRPRRSSAGL